MNIAWQFFAFVMTVGGLSLLNEFRIRIINEWEKER